LAHFLLRNKQQIEGNPPLSPSLQQGFS